MGSYSLYDFTETVADRKDIKRVVAAWGESSEGYGQWEGGFLMELADGSYEYTTGWCDTTGWGCRDGRDTAHFDAEPDLTALATIAGKSLPSEEWGVEPVAEWDREPADLNRWIAAGSPNANAWDEVKYGVPQ